MANRVMYFSLHACAEKFRTKQAVGGRPPRYAPPLSSHVGAEAPSAAEQTET